MKKSSEELNKREKAILKFIEKQVKEKGYPPSVREIGKAVGLSSTATVHGYIEKLTQKGYIKKEDQKGRTLKLLKGGLTESEPEQKSFYSGREMVDVPVIGKISAGAPILAVENVVDTFPIPIDFVGNSESFMLTVKGESMIEAGIYDKDKVIVRRQSIAENGDIIVAMTEEDEATVKRFYKENNRYRLQPENSSMDPIYLDSVTVLGKVVGLFREF